MFPLSHQNAREPRNRDRSADIPSGTGQRRRRGAVLLIILVVIVVLSAALVQFTEKGMTEIVAEGHYVERNRLRLTAFSALECTLGVLADVIAIDGDLTAPAQGWSDPLTVAGFAPGENLKVNVSFVDESGKLPLGDLDEGTLYLLFSQMGLSAEDSLKLTQSLLDWVDEDDEPHIEGAESETYALAEWPYASSNRAVQNLSELSVVDGFDVLFFDEYGRPNEYFRMFSDAVSPYADGNLNVNSASELALLSLAGFGDPQVNALHTFLAGADGILGTDDDRFFAQQDEIAAVIGELPPGITLGVTTQVLRIRVDVSETEDHYVLEAVVQPSRGGATTGGNSTRRNPNQRPNTTATQSTRSSSQTNVPYPFVFLELSEDVGQKNSLAAPVEGDDTTGGGASTSGASDRG